MVAIQSAEILIKEIVGHERNSNRMSVEFMKTLKRHIQKSGKYPPLIVRILEGGSYQVLDGHHRLRVLYELGHEVVRCEVWDVDDDEALLLLATLNRLSGSDDPKLRAELIGEIGRVLIWKRY